MALFDFDLQCKELGCSTNSKWYIVAIVATSSTMTWFGVSPHRTRKSSQSHGLTCLISDLPRIFQSIGGQMLGKWPKQLNFLIQKHNLLHQIAMNWLQIMIFPIDFSYWNGYSVTAWVGLKIHAPASTSNQLLERGCACPGEECFSRVAATIRRREPCPWGPALLGPSWLMMSSSFHDLNHEIMSDSCGG